MGRLIITLLLIGASVGIFMVPTRALMDEAVPIKVERDDYKRALDDADKIIARRNELEQLKNQISNSDEAYLDKFLPNNVDSVRLIVEIKDIVESKRGLVLQDISVSGKEEDLASALEAEGFSSTQLSLSVRGDYFAFKSLLADLERNLRIVDVVDLEINVDSITGEQSYDVLLRTYWISPPKENV